MSAYPEDYSDDEIVSINRARGTYQPSVLRQAVIDREHEKAGEHWVDGFYNLTQHPNRWVPGHWARNPRTMSLGGPRRPVRDGSTLRKTYRSLP